MADQLVECTVGPLTKSLKCKSTCESNLVFTCEFSREFHMSFLTCKLGEIQLWIWKITCEFLHVWIHVWKISHVTSRLKYRSLLKWLTYLKGPIIRDIYVSYRGPIGLTLSYNIGKSCDLQAYLAYTCNIKEHWDFRCSNSPPPHPPPQTPPPPPNFFFTTPPFFFHNPPPPFFFLHNTPPPPHCIVYFFIPNDMQNL